MGKLIDLTDQRFGFWVVKEQGPNKDGHSQWLCVCECGSEKLISSNSLRTGNSTSCGCNHSPNLIGKKFGKLLVIGESLNNKCDRKCWECKCKCGKNIDLTTNQLRNKHITSCKLCPSLNGTVEGNINEIIKINIRLRDKMEREVTYNLERLKTRNDEIIILIPLILPGL